MFNRILPIYRTGWFYLIMLFVISTYTMLQDGAFNSANQLNISALERLLSIQNSSEKIRPLEDKDILSLSSSYDISELPALKRLLAEQNTSQLVLTGLPSKSFIKALETYVSDKNLPNKVIINSIEEYSSAPIAIADSTFLSGVLDWFRFSEINTLKPFSSRYITYSPLLLNSRQSYPLLWQQEDKTYLTLPAQILQALSLNQSMSLNQFWQLSLNNPQRIIGADNLSLGFLGEVFSGGHAFQIDESWRAAYQNQQYKFEQLNEEERETLLLSSLTQFVSEQYKYASSASPKAKYKVIIITENKLRAHELIKPLLLNLTAENYLSQSFLTLCFIWFITIVGMILIILIQGLTAKKQSLAIVSYCIVLFILQSLMYHQQQWLEVLPTMLTMIGIWALLLAYQKEVALFSVKFSQQNNQNNQVVATHRNTVNNRGANKIDYKSPQNFSPTATIASTNHELEPLDQTMVMSPTAAPPSTMQHHITVESFGRYKVEGILGKGAMGIVYQGVDPKINRHVAIKTMQLSDSVESAESREAKQRFFREAQTAGGLSHANIVTIYDVGEESSLGYIAMDLLTGAPLSEFTKAGQTLPAPLVYQLLIQITDALDYAHKQDVVHRDIKPANIIYDDDLLKVTVTDFGIAYVSDHSKTKTGVIMGSPYYMSPEQILGLKVDGRSDIFSLGVTFYQLLSGQLPFEGESIATVAYQITKAKPTAVTDFDSYLPASALRITNKAMHKDIDKRYQSMSEFKQALINALKRDFKITIT